MRTLPIVVGVALLLGGLSPVRAELGREQIENAKAATLLIESPDAKSVASAFCIHPSGLFVTNAHAVPRLLPRATMSVVLNAGRDNQLKFSARVVRYDKAHDLAILKAEPRKPLGDLPTLTLAPNDDGLFETMPLVAFGFPFGKDLAIDRGKYPTVSVNTGRVTALRKKDNTLDRIQVDAQLNPGNSGGPVLDSDGRVIGLVVSGVLGAGVNFVIPVSHVRELLAAPLVTFRSPPMLVKKPGDRRDTFEVDAFWPLGQPDNAAVDLTLVDQLHGPRTFAAKHAESGPWRIDNAPVVSTGDPKLAGFLVAEVHYPSRIVVAFVKDKPIFVGGAKRDLSLIQSILLSDGRGSPPTANGWDLSHTRGKIERLEPFEGFVRGKLTPIDLHAVSSISFRRAAERPYIEYILRITDGDRVAYLEQGTLDENTGTHHTRVVEDGTPLDPDIVANLPGDVPGADPAVEAPADAQVVKTGGTITDVVAAGDGRYLLLYLRDARKLAVFDTHELRIAKEIPIGVDDALIAGGKDAIMIVSPAQSIVQRWSLATMTRQWIKPIGVDGIPKAVTMGYASTGPMLLLTAAKAESLSRCVWSLVDPATMKAQTFGDDAKLKSYSNRDRIHLRASADGKLFTSWCSSSSPGGMNLMRLTGDGDKTAYALEGQYIHSTCGFLLPSPDGRYVLTHLRGVYRADDVRPQDNDVRIASHAAVPAYHPGYYLWVFAKPAAGPDDDADSYVSALGANRPLAPLPPLPEMVETRKADESFIKTDLTFEKRYHLFPARKLLVTIPPTNDRLVLRQFNITEAVRDSSPGVLAVVSSPPPTARPGKFYDYQITVEPPTRGLKYELASGPEGMTVNIDGRVTWKLPENFPEQTVKAIITITDEKAREVIHAFDIRVTP